MWKQIQDRMKPPLCKGHGEPCVIRQVKKGGANQGEPPFITSCTLPFPGGWCHPEIYAVMFWCLLVLHLVRALAVNDR